MRKTPISESRERLLEAADKLFSERGYGAVTVKDIAHAAGIHHASLYHHVPGGKEELFIEVTERSLHRHQAGIQKAVKDGGQDVRMQLQAIAAWLLSQPPMDYIRMILSDMPAIQSTDAARLSTLMFEVLFEPIARVLAQAQKRGEIEHPHLGNIAGAIFAAIQALHTIPDLYVIESRQAMANELIEVFVRGIEKR